MMDSTTKTELVGLLPYLSVREQKELDGLLASSQRQETKEQTQQSLRSFLTAAWTIIEPSRLFIPNWHIDVICEYLEAVTRGDIRRLLINMPPRHMKSLIVSVLWPAWSWIHKPESRWLFSSYAQSLSTRDSVKCRRLVESYWYRSNWGDIFELTSDQNQKTRFENSKTGYRIATSVGGSATGEGGDFIVVDDPHNIEERESDTIRTGVLKWWDEVMSTRVNDPKNSGHVIVMQRVHEMDLSGHVLAQGGYEHLCLEAEYEPNRKHFSIPRYIDPRQEEGQPLWPIRFGPAELAENRLRLGSMQYAGQFQQRPSPAEGRIVKREWWRYFTERPEKFDIIIQSWDMAFKDEDDSSYVVGQVWGKIKADKYLLDQDRRKMDFLDSLNGVVAMKERWPTAYKILIEDKANGPAIITTLKKKLSGIIPIKPTGSKIARAQACTPQIESGNVYLPDPHLNPWVEAFVEEWAMVPNNAYWDQVDASSQALNYFTRVPTPGFF